jgi:hypothetical protein
MQELMDMYPLAGLREGDNTIHTLRQDVRRRVDDRKRHESKVDLVYKLERILNVGHAVRYRSREQIEMLDATEHIGNVTMNEEESHGVPCEAHIIFEFLEYRCVRPAEGELRIESMCGHYLQHIIAGRNLIDKQ